MSTVPSVLDWSRFREGAVGPEDAFEAFASQLFERSVRRAHGSDVKTYILNGAGGDGGVEAFATLADGSVVGLQAKWFTEPLNDSRRKNIERSLQAALKRHPTLRRYVVAMPRNLTTAKPPKKGGVERWNEMRAELAKGHAGLVLERWDEAGLLEQLAIPENHTLRGLWFEGEGLAHSHLLALWTRASAALGERYLPDLHAVGAIEAAVSRDLFEAHYVVRCRRSLSECSADLVEARQRLIDVQPHLPKSEDELAGLIDRAAKELRSFTEHTSHLIDAIERGPIGVLADMPTPRFARELHDRLEARSRGSDRVRVADPSRAPLRRAIDGISTVAKIHAEWARARCPRAVVGPPGCGKTHAAAHLVAVRLEAGLPAAYVAARDLDPSQGLQPLFTPAFDRPNWSIDQLLDGLEALAVLSQARVPGPDHAGPFVRALVVIDGLEESAHWGRWSDRLAELAGALAERPRVHLVTLLRQEARTVIRPARFASVLAVPEDAGTNLALLFSRYCQTYDVNVEAVPWLGWAVRSPLEVRLLAEEFRGRILSAEQGIEMNIVGLFQRKLQRVERSARERERAPAWPQDVQLLLTVLDALVELSAESGNAVARASEITEHIRRRGEHDLSAVHIDHALAVLGAHGLVDSWRPPTEGLAVDARRHRLATRHLADYIVARRVADRALESVTAGRPADASAFPERLTNAAVLAAALLAESDVFVVDDIWDEALKINAERVQLAALSLVPPRVSGSRRDWVRSLVLASTILNREVLSRTILPVARIPDHPLGPWLLDEALREAELPLRDPIWSVPEDLSGDGPWRGYADDVLDHVRLDSKADPWNGRPLIVAWTCSSVVEERRCRARESLAVWGSGCLDQMDHLLDHMARVDDPQVVEDVVVAALGAVLGSAYDDPAIPQIARTVDRLFFSPSADVRTDDVVVRVAARAIVERANSLAPGSVDELLTRARPPYVPEGGKWPELDAAEARSLDSTGSSTIVSGDLSWYVANACDRGFEGGESDVLASPRVVQLRDVERHVLRAVADREIDLGDEVANACSAAIREFESKPTPAELIRRVIAKVEDEQLESEGDVNGAEAPDLREGQQSESADDNPENDEQEVLEAERATIPRWRRQSREIGELYASAARTVGVERLAPNAVRNAMIAAHVRRWGWSEKRFSVRDWDGNPRVVDDAIAQTHRQSASHGSRNAISTFREKYVWAAINHVAGQLADRLPIWDRDAAEWRRLTDLSGVGTRMPDPLPRAATAVIDPDEGAAWTPVGLWPTIYAEITDVVERAQRWVHDAPLPDPRDLVRAPIEDLDDAAVLTAVAARDAHQSCIDPCIWVAVHGVPIGHVELWRRDSKFCRWPTGLAESRVHLGDATYTSAALAAWAPWLSTECAEISHVTIDSTGSPVTIAIHPMAAEVTTRDDTDEEREAVAYLPAPELREALGVVGAAGDRVLRHYLGREREMVAVERSEPHEEWGSYNHYLAVGFGEFLNACEACDMVPVWGVRYYREAAGQLWFDGHRRVVPPKLTHRSRDVEWLVFWNPRTSELEAELISDKLEAF